MEEPRSQERTVRLAGFAVVLAVHGALLYSLWQYRILAPPAQAATVFVSLLQDAPKPQLPKATPRKPQPVRLDRAPPAPVPPPPQQVVAQAPVMSRAEPTAPPPARIEAPPEPAPPPSRPVGPLVLSGNLAVACPGRSAPAYPLISRRLGEQGKAVLRVELDEDGQIHRATVNSSSGYVRLDEAALSAVMHWRCGPVLRNGVAVRAVALQPFNFVLEGR